MKKVNPTFLTVCVLVLFLVACPPPMTDSNPATGPTPAPTNPSPPPDSPTPEPLAELPQAAEELSILYHDSSSGSVATLTVSRAGDESAVVFYNLYWGHSDQFVDPVAFVQLPRTGTDITYEIDPGIVPSDVRKIYVFTENVNGDESLDWAETDFLPIAGLYLVEDFNSSGDSNPGEMCVFNSRLYFTADTPQGRELVYYQAGSGIRTLAGPAGDIGNGVNPNGNPGNFAVLTTTGGVSKLFFRAINGENTPMLYSLDESDNLAVIDTFTDAGDTTYNLSDPLYLQAMNAAETAADNILYFVADNGTGSGLYGKTFGGDVFSLEELSELDADFKQPRELVVDNLDPLAPGNDLYFLAEDPAQPGSTKIFGRVDEQNISLISTQSHPMQYLTFLEDVLYFQTKILAAIGFELGQCDVSLATPTINLVTDYDISAPGASSYPHNLFPYDGKLFLAAAEANAAGDGGGSGFGIEPIMFRPEEPGKQYIINTNPSGDSYPNHFTGLGEWFCYSAVDKVGENDDRELWFFDTGSLTNLQPIKINLNAPGSSYPENLTIYNGKLYFAADTGNGAGKELYCLELLP